MPACFFMYLTQQILRLVEVKHTITPRFYMMRMMPVGLFMTLTLYFGNKVYLYLTVSFIQMLKVQRPWRRPHHRHTNLLPRNRRFVRSSP